MNRIFIRFIHNFIVLTILFFIVNTSQSHDEGIYGANNPYIGWISISSHNGQLNDASFCKATPEEACQDIYALSSTPDVSFYCGAVFDNVNTYKCHSTHQSQNGTDCNAVGYAVRNDENTCRAICPPNHYQDPMEPTICRDGSLPPPITTEKEGGPTCPSPYDSSGDSAPSPATGNTYTKTTDFSGPRRSNSFTRHKSNVTGLANSPLGHGWGANGFQTLSVDGTNIVTMQATGQSEPSVCSGVGACALDADSRISLEQTSTGYKVITASNNVEVYDSVGKLLTVTEPSGQVTTLSHNSNGLVVTMTDHFGSVISFTYNVDNKVATMTDPDSNVYTYAYDANNNLTSVTYPDTMIKRYLYEDSNFPNHITGIIDERSIRSHTWGYDTQGRALYFEKAGGAERVDYTYNIDGTTTVTDSLGATNTFTFAESHGVKRTTAISGGQCATGCAQGQAQSYDANGFLSSRTDFEGNITNYINNNRGLEISRTEAVGTPQARTITTEWHTTFRLPTKITEPGKETTFTYDTNGKLLTRTEKVLL